MRIDNWLEERGGRKEAYVCLVFWFKELVEDVSFLQEETQGSWVGVLCTKSSVLDPTGLRGKSGQPKCSYESGTIVVISQENTVLCLFS